MSFHVELKHVRSVVGEKSQFIIRRADTRRPATPRPTSVVTPLSHMTVELFFHSKKQTVSIEGGIEWVICKRR